MKTLNTLKKTTRFIADMPLRASVAASVLLGSSISAFPADDPFGNNTVDPTQLQQTTDSDLGDTFEHILIGVGIFLVVLPAIRLATIITSSSNSRDHGEKGHTVTEIIIMIVGIVIGFALIGIGWKGASAMAQQG